MVFYFLWTNVQSRVDQLNAMQACAALKEVSRKWDEAACNFNAWRLVVWINATKLCLWPFWNNQQFSFKLETFDPRTFVPRTFVSQVFAPWTFFPRTSLHRNILPPEKLCLTIWERDGDISWTMISRGHFFSKWATSHGHCQRVTSCGHFCSREVLFWVNFHGHFLGEF